MNAEKRNHFLEEAIRYSWSAYLVQDNGLAFTGSLECTAGFNGIQPADGKVFHVECELVFNIISLRPVRKGECHE